MAIAVTTYETVFMQWVRMSHAGGYLSAYAAMVALGRMTTLENTGLALFWPAAGVAALWLLRSRSRDELVLDGILLVVSATAVNTLMGVPPVAAALFGLANLCQGLVVRLVYARRTSTGFAEPLHPTVGTSRELLELVGASLLAAVLSSPVGSAAAWISSGSTSGGLVLAWVVRNACSTFVIAAVVLCVTTAYSESRRTGRPLTAVLAPEPRRNAASELVAAIFVSAASAYLVFGDAHNLPLSYLVVAMSVWIGFRFSPVVGAVHTLTFGTVAVLSTYAGMGPFVSIDDLALRAIVIQLFITITTLVVLLLALGVSERQELHARVRSSEQRATERADLLDAVTSVMNEGLLVIDDAERVVLRNPMAQALAGTGFDDGELRAAEAHGIYQVDGSQLARAEQPFKLALRGEVVAPSDYLRIDPVSGRQRILSISAVPLHRSAGDSRPMAVLVLRDVTTERARRRELEAYAGVVAHDLKNPLAATRSWAELLGEQLAEGHTETTEIRASLDHVLGSADRMSQLIDDLLAYSLSESAELEPEEVSLDVLVAEVADGLDGPGDGLRPALEFHDLGCVHADVTLVRQLLANVLGNAVKYVEPGSQPRVRLTSRQRGDMLEVHVTDNGIGIPPAERDRVFDSFYRSQQTSAYPGTGLGLAISARAVERHGGRISARGGPDGRGTTIIFTLPVEPTRQRAGRTTSAEPPPRREGSDTAVNRPRGPNSTAVAAPISEEVGEDPVGVVNTWPKGSSRRP